MYTWVQEEAAPGQSREGQPMAQGYKSADEEEELKQEREGGIGGPDAEPNLQLVSASVSAPPHPPTHPHTLLPSSPLPLNSAVPRHSFLSPPSSQPLVSASVSPPLLRLSPISSSPPLSWT